MKLHALRAFYRSLFVPTRSMNQDSLVCVPAPPGVFGSAGEHGQPRARAAGDVDGEKILMQQG